MYYPDDTRDSPWQLGAEQLRSEIAELLKGERLLRTVTDNGNRQEVTIYNGCKVADLDASVVFETVAGCSGKLILAR